MESSGYHTPKKSLFKGKNKELNFQNHSPINILKRRKSFIPLGIINSFQSNNENSHKDSISRKKSRKRIFSGETIPEEQENNNKNKSNEKNSKKNKYKNDNENENEKNNYFENFTDNIFKNESHLNKKNITKSPRKINNKNSKRNYISTKTLFNPENRRMSATNSDLFTSQFNKRKETENIKLNMNKDGMTINSNYKASLINKKMCEKIDNLIHKKELTKNEKEIILNYFTNTKDMDISPKNKKIGENLKSPSLRKKKKVNKNNNVTFKNNNISLENQKTLKENTDNDRNNTNKISDDLTAKNQIKIN